MESKYLPGNITPELIRELLSEYPQYIPDSLAQLEEARMVLIPESLRELKKDKEAYLTVHELAQLTEWKLKNGTFRPSLLQLVNSNAEKEVIESTMEAFGWISKAPRTDRSDDVDRPINRLTKLRGVGPATASLILSCYDQSRFPFFSDELYRWLRWDEEKGIGWDRKLKYTKGEYECLYETVHSDSLGLQREELEGHNITALELEKAAYVLGKRTQDLKATKGKKDDNERVSEKRQTLKRRTTEREEPDEGKPGRVRKSAKSKKPEMRREGENKCDA
ncbi:MAG: hypothetical protein Q9157_007873 [Trypethelium eluteriae]